MMCEGEKTLDNAATEAPPVEVATPVAATGLLCQTAAKSKSFLKQALPATQQVLTTVAYNGGYYLAFGVTFPTLFAVHLIPGGTRLVSGFVDGAVAAKQYLDGLQAAQAVAPAEAPSESQSAALA